MHHVVPSRIMALLEQFFLNVTEEPKIISNLLVRVSTHNAVMVTVSLPCVGDV